MFCGMMCILVVFGVVVVGVLFLMGGVVVKLIDW